MQPSCRDPVHFLFLLAPAWPGKVEPPQEKQLWIRGRPPSGDLVAVAAAVIPLLGPAVAGLYSCPAGRGHGKPSQSCRCRAGSGRRASSRGCRSCSRSWRWWAYWRSSHSSRLRRWRSSPAAEQRNPHGPPRRHADFYALFCRDLAAQRVTELALLLRIEGGRKHRAARTPAAPASGARGRWHGPGRRWRRCPASKRLQSA